MAPTTPPPANFSQSEVYSMNPDGGDLRLLTNNDGVRDLDPSFSPNGAQIAFDSRPVGEGSASDVHTMNADGSAVRRITFAPANDERTAWSPDGNNISFMGGRDGNFNIFRVAADGSDTVGARLTTDPAGDFSPAWSPDGTAIAFDTGRDGNSEIYTMDAAQGDGNQGLVRKLTNTDPPVRNWSANWSPDGRRIVFQSTRDGLGATRRDDNFEIYTMNPDGSGVTRLTTTATDDPTTPINEAVEGDPAFSPDGTKIVFESNRTGDTEVYTMNVDGSEVTRLTNNPGFDGRCDWQPIPIAAAVPPVGERPPVGGGPTPTAARVRPNLFRPRGSASQVGRRIVVRVRGRMGGNQGRSCAGRLRIGVRFGGNRRVTRVARMGANCRYAKRVVFPVRLLPRALRARSKPVILRVAVRFQGNAGLKPDVSPTRRIKVRR